MPPRSRAGNNGADGGQASRRNRDADIFQAAISVFSEKGYSAASLQDVADRVGLLKGSLYHYIDSKESLLFRIFHEAHEEAVILMDETTALNLATRDHLYEYARRLTLWYLANYERSALYFTEWRHLTGKFAETVRTERRQFEGYVRAIVTRARDEGLTRPDLDVRIGSYAVLAIVNSSLTWFRPGAKHNREAVARELAEIACASIFTTSVVSTSPEPVRRPPERRRSQLDARELTA